MLGASLIAFNSTPPDPRQLTYVSGTVSPNLTSLASYGAQAGDIALFFISRVNNVPWGISAPTNTNSSKSITLFNDYVSPSDGSGGNLYFQSGYTILDASDITYGFNGSADFIAIYRPMNAISRVAVGLSGTGWSNVASNSYSFQLTNRTTAHASLAFIQHENHSTIAVTNTLTAPDYNFNYDANGGRIKIWNNLTSGTDRFTQDTTLGWSSAAAGYKFIMFMEISFT